MQTQQTIEKLHDLRLPGMAQAYQDQINRGDLAQVSFDDRLGLLVDHEWTVRQERRLRRRLQDAKLKQNASPEDIDYRTPRGLDKQMVMDLLTCRWIKAHRNLIITGPTGVGKTWLSNAFANKTCREGMVSRYFRVPRLVQELEIARLDGSYLRQLAKLARVDLLILDDWGMGQLDAQALNMILEVVDDRTEARSTLVTSQLPVEKWHDLVGDPSTADALLDRLLGTAQHIKLKGGSMRGSHPKSSGTKPAQENTSE